MKPNGEIVIVGAADEDTDHPESKDLLAVLRDNFSKLAKAGGCKAIAIVFDVRVLQPESAKKSDAIQACVEHIDGYSAEVFYPYEVKQSHLNYGKTFAQEGKNEIFGRE
jgi:hypothetical protein